MDRRWLWGLGAAAGAAGAGVAVARVRQRAAEAETRVRRLQAAEAAHGRNLVILGAGFGGVTAAASLVRRLPPESGWTVTLVDRHNYHLFTPLLYHAATGLVDPTSILFPLRRLSHQANYVVREASVLDVDLQRQVVHLDDGDLPYDQLVIGMGGVTNFFGQEGNLRHSLTLKTAADAFLVRNRIIDAFERAEVATDEAERRRCLTFVIVGGGATGIELAGAVRGLIHDVLAKDYPRISPDEPRLVILEAMKTILPGVSPEMAAYAVERYSALGIDLRLETPVSEVSEDGVLTKSGERIPSRTVVWAAGVRPSPLVERLAVPKIKNGRIRVDRYLQVEGTPNVYAIGDIAAFEDPETGKPLPPTAAVAVREGKAVAEIMLARLEGREPEPFVFHSMGELISLGRHEALAEINGVRLTGFPAWLTWRAFYLSQLMGFKNQLSVAFDWSFAYFYQRDTVRIELPAPVVDSLPPREEELEAEEEQRAVAAGS